MWVPWVRGGRISDSSVLRVELGRDILFRDAGVVWWEVISLKTEGADPDLCGVIDAAKGVECGYAGLASEWGVREGGDILVCADRRY